VRRPSRIRYLQTRGTLGPHYLQTGPHYNQIYPAPRKYIFKEMEKRREVVRLLLADAPLLRELADHPLKSEWKPSRDLPMEPDWLLIYCIEGNTVRFERTGTHTDIFGK
jgi:mRNA interferase YafQ